VAGSQALGLPQPADIGSDHPITARIVSLTKLAKQPHGSVAPCIPTLEEIWLIGVKDALPQVATTAASHMGGAAEIALDSA
jgi:hypothetical protein